MLQIGSYIISLDLLEEKFICDLPMCLGNCCRYGDAGAPLDDEEADILESIKDKILPYLRPEGEKSIREQGTSVVDFEGEKVTPLIGVEECAYTIYDGRVLKCAIEKAWEDGKVDFRKPLSCHLFPVRMKKYHDFTAVNYHEWPICHSAREMGRRNGVPVYKFLKEPLTRALGSEIYEQLCIAARELKK
ncbi:MAG: DUF3109 family protein [Bacteroidales bacterium]